MNPSPPTPAPDPLDLEAIEKIYSKGQAEFLTMHDTGVLIRSIPGLIAEVRRPRGYAFPVVPLGSPAREILNDLIQWVRVHQKEGMPLESASTLGWLERIAAAAPKGDMPGMAETDNVKGLAVSPAAGSPSGSRSQDGAWFRIEAPGWYITRDGRRVMVSESEDVDRQRFPWVHGGPESGASVDCNGYVWASRKADPDDIVAAALEGATRPGEPSEPEQASPVTPTLPIEGAPERPGACEWEESDPDFHSLWETACGRVWSFSEDGVKENRMDFCMGCGKPVKAIPYVPEADEDEEAEQGGQAHG